MNNPNTTQQFNNMLVEQHLDNVFNRLTNYRDQSKIKHLNEHRATVLRGYQKIINLVNNIKA